MGTFSWILHFQLVFLLIDVEYIRDIGFLVLASILIKCISNSYRLIHVNDLSSLVHSNYLDFSVNIGIRFFRN